MDFQEAHLISVEDIIIISKWGRKMCSSAPLNQLLQCLSLIIMMMSLQVEKCVEVPKNTPLSTKMAAK